MQDATKVYDGTSAFDGAIAVGDLDLAGLVGGDTVSITQSVGAFNSSDVATADTLTVVYTLDNANYTLNADTFAASITPRVLAFTKPTELTTSSKVYDGTTLYTSTPLIYAIDEDTLAPGDTLDDVDVSVASALYNSKDVVSADTITITITYSVNNANYTIGGDTFSGSITPKTLSMATPATLSTTTKEYDGDAFYKGSATFGELDASGLVGGDTRQRRSPHRCVDSLQ